MNKFEYLPANNELFQELLKFEETVLNICNKLEIKPIIYWSLSCFYYTKDENMSVNDLDFLVSEDIFPELIKMFEQNNISYEQKSWQSIVVSVNNLEIDFDSIERCL